jgi:hypothetical protein
MNDLPPATAALSARQNERTYLRQLSLMLREALHVVGTIQSLREEPMTRLMKLDLLRTLDCHMGHADRLNDELQVRLEGTLQ